MVSVHVAHADPHIAGLYLAAGVLPVAIASTEAGVLHTAWVCLTSMCTSLAKADTAVAAFIAAGQVDMREIIDFWQFTHSAHLASGAQTCQHSSTKPDAYAYAQTAYFSLTSPHLFVKMH